MQGSRAGIPIVRICKIGALVVFLLGFGSNASALPFLTINDPGVVGAHHGGLENSNETTELLLAQFLLDLIAPTSDSNGPAAGGNPCDITNDIGCHATSNTEYAGNIAAPNQGLSGDLTIDAGFDYALAKYGGGDNGGYVLFYLGGAAATLPIASNTLWGRDNTEQFGFSHYTTFVATDTFDVPDGGATLMLLGAALGGLGLVRRRFNA
jgi:VPDSG-CTERM motif